MADVAMVGVKVGFIVGWLVGKSVLFDSSIFSLILSKKSFSFSQIFAKKLPAIGSADSPTTTITNRSPFILVCQYDDLNRRLALSGRSLPGRCEMLFLSLLLRVFGRGSGDDEKSETSVSKMSICAIQCT